MCVQTCCLPLCKIMFLAVSRVKKLRGKGVHNYGIYTLSSWLVKNPIEQIYASIRMPVNFFFFSFGIWLIFLEFFCVTHLLWSRLAFIFWYLGSLVKDCLYFCIFNFQCEFWHYLSLYKNYFNYHEHWLLTSLVIVPEKNQMAPPL